MNSVRFIKIIENQFDIFYNNKLKRRIYCAMCFPIISTTGTSRILSRCSFLPIIFGLVFTLSIGACKNGCVNDNNFHESVQAKTICFANNLRHQHYKSLTYLTHKFDSARSVNSMQTSQYRPRGALARALFEKQLNDRKLRELDKNQWYRVQKDRLSPEMHSLFLQLWPDEETKDFIRQSIDKSSWVWTQVWHTIAKSFLSYFWSRTDINAWLERGSMFVASCEQARVLLAGLVVRSGGAGEEPARLLDVGAGDGGVTVRWAPLFPRRYATEISANMRTLLDKKGFTVLDIDTWWQSQFEAVCLLNLLDRCAQPLHVLRDARRAIAPGGVLVVALVLPYKPYVEVTKDHRPEERLPITGNTLEEQAESFQRWMAGAGWRLLRWSRVPYLCEGDISQAYYWLDDALFVFQPHTDDTQA